MPAYAYVNGRFLPKSKAGVGIEDRGLLFADAVYEVVTMLDGRPLDADLHSERLWASLNALAIAPPMTRAVLTSLMRRLCRLNKLQNGLIYLQVSRGEAPRNHPFPNPAVNPSLFMMTKAIAGLSHLPKYDEGIKLTITADQRWAHPDIKTTNLLPNCLAKQAALEAGFDDVLFSGADGFVREASAANLWLIAKGEKAAGKPKLITPPLNGKILAGITRRRFMNMLSDNGYEVFQQDLTAPMILDQAAGAFLTSASGLGVPVIEIDGVKINGGKPHKLVADLRALYLDYANRSW